MRSARPKTRTLTVYLLKEGVSTPTRALDSIEGLDSYEVRAGRRKMGTLFVRRSDPRPPMWLSFFQGALDRPSRHLLNSSTAAVLLTSASSRRFALTFGHGRHLLKPGSYEENFGLRVTLNAVDPNRIRSVDRKTFDAMSKHTKTQANAAAPQRCLEPN